MNVKSYLFNADVNYIDDLYKQYQGDKTSVDFGWQKFFEGFELGQGKNIASEGISENAIKEINVLNLINDYRKRGHLFTRTNPVRERRKYTPTLDIENFGLEEGDLETTFNAGVDVGIGPAKLKDIIAFLQTTYCESIGVEYSYIRNTEKHDWLKNIFETTKNQPNLTLKEKTRLLEKLNQAVVFESFLHTKYIGQKRFSIEGLECLIPALDSVIHYGSELGVEEFIIGMAHRGRLNVLANIFHKTYKEIFFEFEGKVYEEDFNDSPFEGDVKYHLGFSSNVVTETGKKVHLSMSPNPSHLESVAPVVGGMVRAKLDNRYQGNFDKICPIIIHGDAALAGQGIVYETVQMSGLEANKIGGTIHIVTNNQVGFTTNYLDGRTSTYCTDVAKVTHCPVMHVNGDDVEAVVHAIKIAMAYRNHFNSDIFIDLLGYRKYGHNEGDEPRFTQPLLYQIIAKHPNPREIYKAKLLKRGEIDAQLAKDMEIKFKNLLQEKLDFVRASNKPIKEEVEGITNQWGNFIIPNAKTFDTPIDTKFNKKRWLEIAKNITFIPEDHPLFKKIEQVYAHRREMIDVDSYDWAMGELMGYATLLDEGYSVRLAGQDTERGTFSHRHAVVKKADSEEKYIPLRHVSDKQGHFFVYNTLLSEFAALGYEFGYASATPNTLTLWEAQFGDFSNGGQIITDQYITAGLAKWGRQNGLVMLLPHGYEGQGPEHSSARPERFLQMCANYNIQVVNCTTPANLYHVFRRQMKRNFRIPLIIMTPKSLLRHPLCVSKLVDFTEGKFNELFSDNYATPKTAKKVLFCNGKVYYDLLQKQQEDKRDDVAIIRVEQLYPLPEKQINEIMKSYKNAKFYWVQEEPKNMGAWSFLMQYELNQPLSYIGRKASASPSTGLKSVHEKEQAELLNNAFSL
ncbi:MAG: 2-oxoglutarate dehydrogenase E1 component [Bacteroidetes bacterium]|nr:2-oxoglutarate dehydrogenase E1 component [Bacteroidota bacterium]